MSEMGWLGAKLPSLYLLLQALSLCPEGSGQWKSVSVAVGLAKVVPKSSEMLFP
jgi:hypothetical protein